MTPDKLKLAAMVYGLIAEILEDDVELIDYDITSGRELYKKRSLSLSSPHQQFLAAGTSEIIIQVRRARKLKGES